VSDPVTGLAFGRITLSHFRSYKHAELSPEPGPIAFFGDNGAGKTNLLEAVSMLSPGRGIRRAVASELARGPERLGWKITADLTRADQCHELETFAEVDCPRQVRINGKAAAQVALGKLVRMIWLIPSMDRLWLEGADGRRRFLDRITLSFFPGHAEVSLTYDKAMRERNRLLKEGVQDSGWFRALEKTMSEAAVKITVNRSAALARIQTAQRDGETTFPSADLALVSRAGPNPLPAGDADALAEILEKSRPREFAAGRTLTGPHRDDLSAVYAAKGVEARLCSTGEQKALLISVILANARAISAEFGAPPIILLDEVAAHLDEHRRGALFDELCALKAQSWLTGTDARLFQSLGTRAQFFEVCDDGVSSQIKER